MKKKLDVIIWNFKDYKALKRQPYSGEPALPTGDKVSDRWQSLADDARSVANEMTDEDAKAVMLGIADKYALLAERARAREKAKSSE